MSQAIKKKLITSVTKLICILCLFKMIKPYLDLSVTIEVSISQMFSKYYVIQFYNVHFCIGIKINTRFIISEPHAINRPISLSLLIWKLYLPHTGKFPVYSSSNFQIKNCNINCVIQLYVCKNYIYFW